MNEANQTTMSALVNQGDTSTILATILGIYIFTISFIVVWKVVMNIIRYRRKKKIIKLFKDNYKRGVNVLAQDCHGIPTLITIDGRIVKI